MSTSPVTLNIGNSLRTNIPGWRGIVGAHMQGWFGEKNGTAVHRINRYLSNDPVVINNQLNLMYAIGIRAVIVDWEGPTVNPFLHEATIAIWEGCMEHQMLFGIMLDPWVGKQQPDPTQAVITALQNVDFQRMLNSPAYLPEKYVLEFDLANSAGVDVATVQAAVPTIPILSWHTGYAWPNIITGDNPSNPKLSLAALAADHAKPTMKIASANIKFCDGGQPTPPGVLQAAWNGLRNWLLWAWPGNTATRWIDHQAGNWWFDQVATIPASMPYVFIPTWNDYDEETGFEYMISILAGIRLGK